MLLKVKPDGSVYEVQFTSQLMTASRDTMSVGSNQLQSDAAPRTFVSEVNSDAVVTCVSCITDPVVSTVPHSSRRQVLGHVSDSSCVLKSSTGWTPTCHDSHSVSDGILRYNAVTKTANSEGCASNTKTLEHVITTGSTVHSDVDCR